MNVLLTALGVLLLWLPAPAPVHADSLEEARQAIQARYDAFGRAYMKKDFTAVAALFAPDCPIAFKGGKKTIQPATLVQGMRALAGRMTVSNLVTRITGIKAVDGGFEVTAELTGDSVYTPPRGSKDDPPRRGKADQATIDTWQKSSAGWVIVKRLIEGDDPD